MVYERIHSLRHVWGSSRVQVTTDASGLPGAGDIELHTTVSPYIFLRWRSSHCAMHPLFHGTL